MRAISGGPYAENPGTPLARVQALDAIALASQQSGIDTEPSLCYGAHENGSINHNA